MPPVTRRRALLAVASGVATLAGCPEETDERPSIEPRHRDRRIENHEVEHVRNEDGAVLFSTSEALPTVGEGPRGRHGRGARRVLVVEQDVQDLTFGDVPEAERLRSFVAATDFEQASIYLLAMPVEACQAVRLQSASVERDELANDDLHPHADFCRTYRPADVECDADATHTVGVAIRLPVAAERSTGSGRGMGGSCGPSPRDEYFEASVTPAGGDGE
jgi:hypothetical protein